VNSKEESLKKFNPVTSKNSASACYSVILALCLGGEFWMNLAQLSPLSGVAIPACKATRTDTVPAYVDWRACTTTPTSRVS
jgi:hypothetical protein